MAKANDNDENGIVQVPVEVIHEEGIRTRSTGEDVTIDVLPTDPVEDEGLRDSEPDGRKKSSGVYSIKKKIAEGMMDISLLTANANQLRFIMTYNYRTNTYYFSMSLIILSLALQILVGIALIVRRHFKNKGNKELAQKYNLYLIIGIFLITVINVLAATLTTTDSAVLSDNSILMNRL